MLSEAKQKFFNRTLNGQFWRLKTWKSGAGDRLPSGSAPSSSDCAPYQKHSRHKLQCIFDINLITRRLNQWWIYIDKIRTCLHISFDPIFLIFVQLFLGKFDLWEILDPPQLIISFTDPYHPRC